MKFTKILASLALLASVLVAPVQAADVNTVLTAGAWAESNKIVGDVVQVTKLTRLTAAVSTTQRLQVPANALNQPVLVAYGTNTSAGGISPTINMYPTQAALKLTGGLVSYTDAVVVPTPLADVTTASPTTISLVGRDYSDMVVTTGASASGAEALDVRVIYAVPRVCRWPNC